MGDYFVRGYRECLTAEVTIIHIRSNSSSYASQSYDDLKNVFEGILMS
jgi:hypothetical protein